MMLVVSDAEQVEKIVAEVVEHFGSIDVFVANAGSSLTLCCLCDYISRT